MRGINLDYFKEIVIKIRRLERLCFIGYLTIPMGIGFYILKQIRIKLVSLNEEKEKILHKLELSINDKLLALKNKYQDIVKNDVYLIYSEKKIFISQIWKFKTELEFIQEYSEYLQEDFIRLVETVYSNVSILLKETKQYNNQFVQRKKIEYATLFKRENLILDDEQQRAVIIDDKHNLVIAGAGSGKTEVLTTRIAYLVKRESDKINPKRILALAFQNKAANEIKTRLKKRYGIIVEGRTFHSLGKKIVDDYAAKNFKEPKKLNHQCSEDYKYRIFIQKIFDKTKNNDKEFQNLIISFIKQFSDDIIIKEEVDFEKKEEYYEYQRSLTYTTLDGTKVRSESEREIANFFIMNNLNRKKINILYEEPANWMTYEDEEGNKHTPNPDFYFPDFDIYLEHWAIDKNGYVPKWFSGENPSEKYRENMNIKRSKYIENDKILIETTEEEIRNNLIYQSLSEKFLTALQKKYPEEEFKLTRLSYNELVEKVWEECKEFVKRLPMNISRYIKIAKTYGLSISDIKNRINKKWSPKQVAFAKIAMRIYQEYEKELEKNYSLDYCDMINHASKYLEENIDFYQDTYDHILVDEYQDISAQRYNLINELLKKNPKCKLFCVGDDWQSIMGFAGSNLDYFIHFDRYFDHPAKTDLIRNYRSIKSIVNVGAAIIKNNVNQINKQTIAYKNEENPILVYSSRHKKDYLERYYEQVTSHALEKINELVKNGYSYDDFMILLRIAKNPKLRKFLGKDNIYRIPISDEPYKPDCVHLLSVHRSKGLESKIVILLNVDKGLYGFPCELENPDIFETAIKDNDGYREQEERRLFYVALTRAKEQVIIYTQKHSESSFITEIKEFIRKEELYY